MDLRTPLEKNTVLHFPGMECVIGSCCGRGANIMAYTGRYRDHLDPSLSHLVLIRELFPYDPQGGITRESNGKLKRQYYGGPIRGSSLFLSPNDLPAGKRSPYPSGRVDPL